MNNLERIVHLDLKGAPWKVPYLEKVMQVAKSWGATGFLFEWEDTFPYANEISQLGSLNNSGGDGMYTMAEIQHLFQFARDNNLVAIQLVQTIGHLEFVLKHPAYRGLREIPSSPAVMCPSNPGSQILVRAMVDQALEAQPDARYFHIGADEVWHKGVCPECQRRSMNNRWRSDCMYLEHIQNLSLYIKRKRPALTILMWDDMLRTVDEDALKVYDLSNIQLVYWNYNNLENFQTDFVLWQKYTKLFPKIWAGSAFKGANGSCKVISPASRYVSNHDAWIREMNIYKESITFVGIILTGWSRYDHYATMCELLPVMLPSLASCLGVLTKSETVPREQIVREVLAPQSWPGEELARCVRAFVLLQERCNNLLHGDEVKTWLNNWQRERRYTVCIHVQSIAYTSRVLQKEIQKMQEDMTNYLHQITGPRATEEWVRTHVAPLVKNVTELFNSADTAMTRDAAVL